jgi:hypothetical protein
MSNDNIAAVLSYKSKGILSAGPQTIGANGEGTFSIIYYGDPDKAARQAERHIKDLEKAGHRIESIHLTFANEDVWGKPTLQTQSIS